MTDIASTNHANIVMAVGQAYRVSTGGSASVEVIYGGPAGTTTLTAETKDFGPYSAPAKIRVTATSGAASYSLLARRAVEAEAGGALTAESAASVQGTIRLAQPVKLTRTFQALMKVKAGTGSALIAWVDDSTGVGAGAGTGAKGLLAANPGSPIAHLVSEFIAAGIPAAHDSWFGEHFVQAFQATNFSAYDTRFSVSSSASYYPNGLYEGLGGIPFQLNSTGKAVNFVPSNTIDTVKVFHFNSLTGAFDTTYNGGASVGVTTNSGAQTVGVATKALTRAAPTSGVSVSWSSGDNAIIGMLCTDSLTPRVNVVNLGIYGEKLTSANGYANNTGYWRFGLALAALNPDLAIVGQTVNSYVDGLAGVPTYITALTKVCQDVVSNGTDLMVLLPHAVGTTAQSDGTADAYIAAARAVAANFGAPVLDLYARLNSYSVYNGYGLYFDGLHLSNPGYRGKGSEAFRSIMAACGLQ